MKKLGMLALLLSLGLFTFGCSKTEGNAPVENGDATEMDDAAPAENGDAVEEAAPAEEAPAEPDSEG